MRSLIIHVLVSPQVISRRFSPQRDKPCQAMKRPITNYLLEQRCAYLIKNREKLSLQSKLTAETELYTLVASSGGGALLGWGFGKLIKLVIKLVMMAAGAIIGVIMYMQSQGIVQVDWDKLQEMSSGVSAWISSFVVTDSLTNDGAVHSIAANLGMTSVMGLVPGFFFGFLYGIKS